MDLSENWLGFQLCAVDFQSNFKCFTDEIKSAVIALQCATFVLVPALASGRTNLPDSTFPCKSSPLWLHHSASVTLLQYSWEISISYWPKIASVVSFHLLSGLCWGSDLLWDLQSIAHKASEGFWPKKKKPKKPKKLAAVTGKHPSGDHMSTFN